MSAEIIIKRIKTDAEHNAKKIRMNAEQKATEIKKQATEKAKQDTDQIIHQGKQQAENRKKILISQARQESKRAEIQAKNAVIEDCFTQAYERLKDLDETSYEQLVKQLMEQGKKRLAGTCTVQISREQDKNIAKDLNISITGSIKASGGIKLSSQDGSITIDNTFEGILKREKARIREKVGKHLFT